MLSRHLHPATGSAAELGGQASDRAGAHAPALAYAPGVDQREPLSTREDALIFGVIAFPIFAVTILIITLVVVLGTR